MTIANTFSWNGILNAILIIISGISIYVATKQTVKKSVVEIQKQVIDAQTVQIQSLKDRVAELEQKNAILLNNQETIIAALSKIGIKLSVDGEFVTIAKNSEILHKRTPRPSDKQEHP